MRRAGHSVHGIGHGQWPTRDATAWGIEHWVNSEIDSSGLDTLLRASGTPERIFHLAGGSSVGASLSNPLEDFARTVSTSARLLDWVRNSAPKARVVASSSAAVYGAGYEGPISENERTRPYSPYGHHKVMMEEVCRSYSEAFDIRCTAVRLFSVYGPWLRKQLLWDLCSRLQGRPVSLTLGGTGNELRDWIEIADVVRVLERASALEESGMLIINGGTGVATPVSRIAEMVIAAWETEIPVFFSGAVRTGDPFSLIADTAQAFDFQCEVPVEKGIPAYVEWFRQSQQ